MPVAPVAGQGNGVAFLVSSGIVYEIVAAACSSPQTAELNARGRSPTLKKWVYVGLLQSALFVGAAAVFDRAHAKPIIAGGAVAAVLLYVSYAHALRSGLASTVAPTETYPAQAAP